MHNHRTGSTARSLALFCVLLTLLLPGCKAHDPRDTSDHTLRVMSYNLRVKNFGDTLLGNGWNSRKNDLVPIIKKADPDLLGTQEGLAGQVGFIRKKLKWYDVHGVGRDNGRTGGEYCAIYYRRVRFTLEDGGHVWFNDANKPGRRTWGSVFPRMASWARLHDKFTGQTVLAVNTHLDVFSEESRVRSARMLRELIDRHPDAYVILTGDFNCDIGSEPFRILTGSRNPPEVRGNRGQDKGRRLIDTYTAAGHIDNVRDGTRPGFHFGNKSGDRIDWVLVCPEIKVLKAAIVHDKPLFDAYPSDHYPVTASLMLPQPAGR